MANNFEKLIITNEEVDARIARGIEENRKGNFFIKVVDKGDVVKKGVKVSVVHKKHKFKFGANIFMLDEFDEEWKNEVYKEKFKKIFNIATLPFYWNGNEPEQGKTRYHKTADKLYRRPPTDLCVEFCLNNGIEPREHALCYEHWYPEWATKDGVETLMLHLEKRMKGISERYAKDIPTIEVTNELFYWEGVKEIIRQMPDYVERCYALARKYFPNNQLCINEEQIRVWQEQENPDYYVMIKELIQKGCPIDAIGAQFHMFKRKDVYYEQTRTYYNLPNMFRVLDKYASFGKPFQITEITIPAYSGEAEAEEEQADILEKMYSLWFSHPAMEQIVYWNLVDGYANGMAPGDMSAGENYYHGGLLRFDMSEKPAYQRLYKLLNEKWNTEGTFITDENGEISFRGFFGDYEVVLEDESGSRIFEAKFYKNNDSVEIK